jgi:hypothetical protein
VRSCSCASTMPSDTSDSSGRWPSSCLGTWSRYRPRWRSPRSQPTDAWRAAASTSSSRVPSERRSGARSGSRSTCPRRSLSASISSRSPRPSGRSGPGSRQRWAWASIPAWCRFRPPSLSSGSSSFEAPPSASRRCGWSRASWPFRWCCSSSVHRGTSRFPNRPGCSIGFPTRIRSSWSSRSVSRHSRA